MAEENVNTATREKCWVQLIYSGLEMEREIRRESESVGDEILEKREQKSV